MNNGIIVQEIQHGKNIIGQITLNRPQALNSLTQNMCQSVLLTLERWQKNPEICFVVINSSSDKAFCAGGDVRLIAEHKQADLNLAREFFQTEYAMNAAIFHFTKPYIAFCNGITMGGGVGISIYGSHRIATEQCRWAMPETGIGFFPDIGAGYFLTRAPGRIGWYLGLTGNSITGADAVYFGFCSHYVPSSQIAELHKKLIKSADISIIDSFNTPIKQCELEPFLEIIDYSFSGETMEDIFERLESFDSDFCRNTLQTLKKRSPTSLKVTLQYLDVCQGLSFPQILQNNLNLAMNFVTHHDFSEGIRALLIDKDKNPKWQPDKLEKVTDDFVEQFFKDSF